MTRDDLVTGPANALAVEAVDAWPHWPHPVLMIVGPPGAGKTHLASAWTDLSGALRWAADDRDPPAGPEPFAVLVEDVDRGGYDEAGLFALLNAARLGGGSVLLTSRSRRGPSIFACRTCGPACGRRRPSSCARRTKTC